MVMVHQRHPIKVNWMKGFWHTGEVNVHRKTDISGIRFKQPHSLRKDKIISFSLILSYFLFTQEFYAQFNLLSLFFSPNRLFSSLQDELTCWSATYFVCCYCFKWNCDQYKEFKCKFHPYYANIAFVSCNFEKDQSKEA